MKASQQLNFRSNSLIHQTLFCPPPPPASTYSTFPGMIRYLSAKLAIFVEFCYSLSVFPGETQVLPCVIIVEIYRSKPETKQSKKQTILNIESYSLSVSSYRLLLLLFYIHI